MHPLLRPAVLILSGILAAGPLAGQDRQARDSTTGVIRVIRVQRTNIFADSEATYFMPRFANRFHVTTQAVVVERELLFRVGQPLDSATIAETGRNLRRLGVFRLVAIDTVHSDTGVLVDIRTQDGWSTKPEFSFRSTGGQVAWRVALVEENLFGTASHFVASYQKDPDRNSFLLGLRQPRLFANSIGLDARFEDRSDGRLIGGSLYQPFTSLEDRHGWGVSVDTRDERILQYFDGEPFPSDTLQRQFDAAVATYGWALRSSARGYQRFGLTGRVYNDTYVQPDTSFGPRLAQGAVGGAFEWRHARYILVRGFRATREEDVDLSTTVRLGVSVTPKLFGWDQNGIVPSLNARIGGVLKHGAFGYIDLNAHGRLTSAGLDSGAVQAGATVVYSPMRHHALIAHTWMGWLANPRPGGEFDLGLGLGPRAFRLHAFTGDRGVFSTGEYRVVVAQDWLKVLDLAVAGFADYGGAWYHGSTKRTGWDAGVGIRLGPSRSTDLSLSRIDLAWRGPSGEDPGGWVVVIGRGLVFSTAGILSR